jgi:hypothetical protein
MFAQNPDDATVAHDTPADWVPFTYAAATRRRADALLARMTHPNTPTAERALSAQRFVSLTGAMPALSADDAPYEVLPDEGGVIVECNSGGGWAACDPSDPVSVAEAVRVCGAVPRYWRGTMRAAYIARGAVAA